MTAVGDRKSTRLNSSHANISYAVFCLKKKNVSPGNRRSAEQSGDETAARRCQHQCGVSYARIDRCAKRRELPRTARCFFFFNDTATTEIYTLSLHDALPI